MPNQKSSYIFLNDTTPVDVRQALELLSEDYPDLRSTEGKTVTYGKCRSKGKLDICMTESQDSVCIQSNSLNGTLRAISSILGNLGTFSEKTSFSRLGIMLDCSRNRVMTPDHFKGWLRRMALMGYTYAFLYCEDIYELEGEPLFGYMRGAYSMAEIRDMDDYASKLGIELIGCIELLAHMDQALKWATAYGDICDLKDIFLIDEEKTAIMMEKMLSFWATAVRSRRIHIGLDEAHDMLRGKYYDRHGTANPFDAFNRHVNVINGICTKLGLKPMMWSDTYFRLADKSHDYYSRKPLPKDVADRIPKNMEMVYWDYYNTKKQNYLDMINCHCQAGFKPILGSGCWQWGGSFWYDDINTMRTAIPGIAAAREAKLDDIFFTLWGDNGTICDTDSLMVALSRCADLVYGTPVKNEFKSAKRFKAICKDDYAMAIAAGRLPHELPVPGKQEYSIDVPTDRIIYDDPLYGIIDNFMRAHHPSMPDIYLQEYKNCLKTIAKHQKKGWAGNFIAYGNILKLIIMKMELRRDFVAAYDAKNKKALRSIAEKRIPEMIKVTQNFIEEYESVWLAIAKPFGLEVMDGRNAGLFARFAAMKRRIVDYLEKRIPDIPELEARRMLPPEILGKSAFWLQLAQSPSLIR